MININIEGQVTYAQYLAKKYKEPEMINEYMFLIKLGKDIINSIKFGVMCEDNNIRKFDIIDYYFLTELSMEELFYIIRDELTSEEIRIYRNFQQYYGSCVKLSEKSIFDNTQQTISIKLFL